jgi:hypothetical protein
MKNKKQVLKLQTLKLKAQDFYPKFLLNKS